MAETRKRVVNPLPPLPTSAGPRKRVVNPLPPLPTTASIAPQPPSLSPMPRPDDMLPVVEPTPTLPAVVSNTERAPQPQDQYEMSLANVRDWQGQLVSGAIDATIGSIPMAIGALQGVAGNWTRDPATYPEDVSRESGLGGALSRWSYNAEHTADDEQRLTDKARRGLYELSTKAGDYAVNPPLNPAGMLLSPVSTIARVGQSLLGEDGGAQTFERDPEAELGEPGYVAPSKEMLPDIATAFTPLPGSKLKLLGYASDIMTSPPALLDRGLRMVDNLLEWFTPFAIPGTKGNMAINAGITGAVDEGLRAAAGADTMVYDPLVSLYERTNAGIKSSGISGYEDITNESYVKP